jgi:Ran GTPase-activating protein 1
MGGLFSSDQEASEQKFLMQETGKQFNTRDQIHEGSQHLLEHSHKVTEIILSQNSYGIEACAAIAQSIGKCENLRVANLSDIFTGRLREEVTTSMTYLSEALLLCTKLEVLNLSDNAFGPDGVKSFSILLEKSLNLKELNVTNNGLGPEGARLIAEGLKKNPNIKLEVFAAGRDRLENPGIIELAQVFGQMQSLRKISVPQNGIRKEGMVALFRNLINNPELQIIEINDNYLNDEEAYQALSACIENLNYLAVVNIGDCMLGDKGCTSVVSALKSTSPHLLELHLQYNELESPKVYDELLELILIRKNLEVVKIQGNEFKPSFKKILNQMIEKSERELSVTFYSSGEEEQDQEDDDLIEKIEDMSIKDD